MKRLVVLMLIVLISISSVACGKKDAVVETVQTMDMDEIDSHDVTTLKQKNDDDDVVFDCEYKIDGMSNLKLREIVESGYQFSGYVERNGRVCVLLTPKVEIPEITAFIDSLNGLTIAQLKEDYNPTFGYMGYEGNCALTAKIGDFTIWFEIEHQDKALQECLKGEDVKWEDFKYVQNDQIRNVDFIDFYLSAPLTEESNKKLTNIESMTSGDLLIMDTELEIEYVGYNIKND